MNKPRLWSLLDIMNHLNLHEFFCVLQEIHFAQATLKPHKGAAPGDIRPLLSTCDKAAKFCKSVNFEHSAKKAWSLGQRISINLNDFDCSMLVGELQSLHDDLQVETHKHQFVQADPSIPHLFENPVAFGAEVAAAFPSIADDLREAGNCLVVGCSTAAVFHLMRIVELALWAFAKHLGLESIVTKKGRSTPVEYSQWDQILRELPDLIEKKIATKPAGPKRQQAQQFYHGAQKEIGHFKDSFRNHVAHARKFYDRPEAYAIHNHVERFMRSLAENGVKGGKKKRGV